MYCSRPPLEIEVSDLVALAGLHDGNATRLAYVVGLLEALREQVALHAENTTTIDETLAEYWKQSARDMSPIGCTQSTEHLMSLQRSMHQCQTSKNFMEILIRPTL